MSFAYDGGGNRQSHSADGDRTTYQYTGGTNQLALITKANMMDVVMDAAGNTIQHGSRDFIYNQANRLSDVEDDGVSLGSYTYSADGRRVKKVVDGRTTVFHYDLNGQLIAESNGQGNFFKLYIYLEKVPLSLLTQKDEIQKIYYYHTDHLNTPLKITDSNATIVWAADYAPFGRTEVMVDTIENNLRFSGQYFDAETELHYNYWRYYDPEIGRYLTTDPIGIGGGINPYVYVENNPVNNVDPFGLFPSGWWKINSWKEKHYNRNQYNQKIGYSEATKKWKLLTPAQSAYHQMGPGNGNNQKYISPDGHSEAVFHIDGTIVSDPLNMATYNYSSPDNWVGHFSIDVIPYWIWGNSPDDPSHWYNRISGVYWRDTSCE
jgi:RHS repeat-associated protein